MTRQAFVEKQTSNRVEAPAFGDIDGHFRVPCWYAGRRFGKQGPRFYPG